MILVASIVLATVFSMAAMAQPSPAGPERLRPLPEVSQNLKTGPEIGALIPGFQLPDQNGATRSLKDLSGPKGLVLAFVRSADW
jgi:hypothetical protein